MCFNLVIEYLLIYATLCLADPRLVIMFQSRNRVSFDLCFNTNRREMMNYAFQSRNRVSFDLCAENKNEVTNSMMFQSRNRVSFDLCLGLDKRLGRRQDRVSIS